LRLFSLKFCSHPKQVLHRNINKSVKEGTII
jgi:hypothetical protein